MQRTQQEVQRDHLLRRAVVFVLASLHLVIAMTAFVAHADAVSVVAFDVTAFHGKGATVIERTVSRHKEVIPRISSKPTLSMITLQLLDGILLRRSRV